MRLHRSISKLIGSVNPARVANKAEDYLEGAKVYRSDLNGIRGLISTERIRKGIRKIDSLEREIVKYEEKIDRLKEKRAMEAIKLQDNLAQNIDVLSEYFEPSELKEFR